MLEVLVGVIALLPALFALFDRRRQTSAIRSEIDILQALPTSMKAQRKAMKKEIGHSIDRYNNREQRRVANLAPFGLFIGYILLLLGLQLTDSASLQDTVKVFRGVLAGLCLSIGSMLMLFTLVYMIRATPALLKLTRLQVISLKRRAQIMFRQRKIKRLERKTARLKIQAAEKMKTAKVLHTEGQERLDNWRQYLTRVEAGEYDYTPEEREKRLKDAREYIAHGEKVLTIPAEFQDLWDEIDVDEPVAASKDDDK